MKMDRTLSGLSMSSACSHCLVNPRLWSDVATIEAGFPKERSLQLMLQIYNDLKDEDGNVKSRRKDWDKRFGLTRKPIAKMQSLGFTVTHKVRFLVH